MLCYLISISSLYNTHRNNLQGNDRTDEGQKGNVRAIFDNKKSEHLQNETDAAEEA